MTDPKQPEAPFMPAETLPAEEPAGKPEPKKLRLEPTRYGDWELNGKCVDF